MIGTKLLHYEILEKIGEGGMGVVYKARDTHLDRFVAIKVLPPEMVAHAGRKARFVQEAKAASALNHPNIVTIYDISSEAGTDFIAMEYVAGKTLDQLIPRKGLRLNETLKVAVQIAGALARAHSAGIIHRDLKPANIMADEHGQVKVLDFGLAKLSDQTSSDDESTVTNAAKTEEGSIVGTAAYMSPEQAEGRPVDARSDIFSFGSVLYEMVTGRRAFSGDSKMSTLAAILKQEPQPLPLETPRDLEKIITRCLRKDLDRRFHTMKDVQVELEELKEDSESGKLPAVALASSHGPGRGRRVVWGGAVLVSLIAVVAAGWFWWVWRGKDTRPLAAVQLTTSPGMEDTPALSPDGRQYAFSWAREGNRDIYVSQVGVEGAQRLTEHPGVDLGPQWSPDGQYIAFTRFEGGGLGLWKSVQHIVKPQRGGREQVVFKEAGLSDILRWLRAPALTWLPDSRRLLVVGRGAGDRVALLLVTSEGEVLKEVLAPPAGYRLVTFPSLSAKGDALAFAAYSSAESANVFVADFSAASSTVGNVRQLTTLNRLISGVAWVGEDVVYSDQGGLWRVRASGVGKPERLGFSGAGDASPAYSPLARRLLFSRTVYDEDLFRLEIGESGQASAKPAALPWNSTKADFAADISPDGSQVAFVSARTGNREIWVGGPGDQDARQLTSFNGPDMSEPRWSPDGRWIAFSSSAEGNREIYVISATGGRPKRLTKNEVEDGSPAWSPDGKSIYYVSATEGLFRIPAEGGEPVLILKPRTGWRPAISGDGRHIFVSGTSVSLLRFPVTGGEPEILVTDLHRTAYALAGDRLYYIAVRSSAGGYPLMEMDLVSRRTRQAALLDVGNGTLGNFLSVWRGGSRTVLVYAESRTLMADLMMVEGFR